MVGGPLELACSQDRGAHLKMDGLLQGHSVVEHAMLQVVHHRLVAPDAVGESDGCPAQLQPRSRQSEAARHACSFGAPAWIRQQPCRMHSISSARGKHMQEGVQRFESSPRMCIAPAMALGLSPEDVVNEPYLHVPATCQGGVATVPVRNRVCPACLLDRSDSAGQPHARDCPQQVGAGVRDGQVAPGSRLMAL